MPDSPMPGLTYADWMKDLYKSLGAFKQEQELNGELMDDEGICLDEVPVCIRCGLEMANRTEHEVWHQQQEGKIMDLMAKVDALEAMIKNLIGNVQTVPTTKNWPDNGYRPQWISDEEIRKYGWPGSSKSTQGPGSNPYKMPPKFKSGEKYDRHQ